MRRKLKSNTIGLISHEQKVRIRFEECDPLGIVWHGNYIRYFEDGREGFGRTHGISYLDQRDNGYATPIVSSICEHKLPLRYGDVATIHTYYVDSPAAKVIFRYEILDTQGRLACKGETVQVFVTLADNELSLTLPDFVLKWKRKMKLIDE